MGMNAGMKMMMLDYAANRGSRNSSEYGGNRRMIGYDRDSNGQAASGYGGTMPSNYGGGYGGNDIENRRRRDSRGRYMESEGWEDRRAEYDENRYGRGGGVESRRRRDSRGRYAMDGADDEDDDYGHRARMMDGPPHMGGGNEYRDSFARGTVYAPNAKNRPMGGMNGDDMEKPVDERTARKWVANMDGGEHFKPEQTEQLRTTICPECEKWEFFVAMNAMYSDYCETIKKMGMDKPEAYAHLAKDFLMDKDAKPHKLRIYMETIPK